MAELKLESVRHAFKGKTVLDLDYVEFAPGKTTAIVGRNGCGKSTLFNILFGQLKADYSRIIYKGRVQNSLYRTDCNIAYLFQDSFIPSFLTVKQFIRNTGLEKKKQQRITIRFDKILKQKISSLSTGEKRLLEIHYILALKKDWTILDEPFNGLAPKMIEEVKEMLKSEKRSIIISSHLYREITSIAHEIFLLDKAKLCPFSTENDMVIPGYIPSKSNI